MKDLLDMACLAYYQDGDPILTDAQFDRLAELHNYNKVGYTPTDGVAHTYQMYSLQKCFDILNAPFPVLDTDVVLSVKLDGAAVALTYINGQLVQALTRGDGFYGKDILDKMKHIVPEYIRVWGIVQITGEVVAPDNIENARNYAAGALNLKSTDEFLERNVNFIAYDMQPSHLLQWTGTMSYLLIAGFGTVYNVQDDIYPTDGMVYRMNDYKDFDKQGYTAHHPRGAFALKEKKDGVITTLIDVKWQVGKSGVVSPVGILEPVTIGDAVVQKATLHNIDYIKSLNLEIGCKVEVIRSGEIIPRILRRVDEK